MGDGIGRRGSCLGCLSARIVPFPRARSIRGGAWSKVMARRKPAKSQFETCTQDCGGRCCRYLTVEVSQPRSRADWDEMRWWLAHEGVMVSKDDEGWLLHIQTPCTNLRADNACGPGTLGSGNGPGAPRAALDTVGPCP